MNQRDPGRAYRRKANGEEAGRRQWQRYKRPATDDVERESRNRRGELLDDADTGAGKPRTKRSSKGRKAPGAGASTRRPGRWVAATVVAAGVGAGAMFVFGEKAPDPLPAEEAYRPLLTDEVLAQVAAKLKAATGSTQVLDVWFEGLDYIRISVPPKNPGDLADDWWWRDGTFERRSASQPPQGAAPFDLLTVDPDVLVSLDEDARARSDGDISRSLAKVQRPRYAGDHWIYLRVAEVDHGAVVLWSDLAGAVESDLVYEDWRDD